MDARKEECALMVEKRIRNSHIKYGVVIRSIDAESVR